MTNDQMNRATTDEEAVDSPAPEIPEAFAIADEGSANWLARRIVEARRYAEHVRNWAAVEIRRAENDERFLLQRYGMQLERWVREELVRRGGRRRSLRLPAGDVGFRLERSRLVVTNESKLISWCREHLPSAIVTVENVLKSKIHDHFASTGELAEGADIQSGGERFFIR